MTWGRSYFLCAGSLIPRGRPDLSVEHAFDYSSGVMMRATTRSIDDPNEPGTVYDVERPDYDACMAVVRAEIPAGHRLLSVQVDRD